MADTIPDLWPISDLKTAVLTPIAILRTQATRLAQNTQGLLTSEVRVTNGEKGQVILSFDVVVPAMNNYRHRLLSVQHTKNAIYPAIISAEGLTITKTISGTMFQGDRTIKTSVDSKTAYSDKQFIRLVQEVLQAPETIALLQSLIVRSNEETVGSSSTDEENIGQSGGQEE